MVGPGLNIESKHRGVVGAHTKKGIFIIPKVGITFLQKRKRFFVGFGAVASQDANLSPAPPCHQPTTLNYLNRGFDLLVGKNYFTPSR